MMLPEPADLYDVDFVAWTEHTAQALLHGRLTSELRQQVAGEIADMGKRDYREGRSRLVVLLAHVLKSLDRTERSSRSRHATIANQRTDLNTLLRQSPSLRPKLEGDLRGSVRGCAVSGGG